MTEEYKENLMREITGQVVEGTPIDTPQFETSPTITNNMEQFLIDNGHIEDCGVQFYVTRNNKMVLFYEELDENLQYMDTFIVIADYDMTPIAIIDTLYSGNPIPKLYRTIDNDIGEGRIYGFGGGRLYYLNDPTAIKEGMPYQIEILNSYALDNVSGGVYKKSPDTGSFVFVFYDNGTLTLKEFIINVGAPNEWNTYTYSVNSASYIDMFPIWGEELKCRIVYARNNSYIDVLDLGESLTLTKSIQLQSSNNVMNLKLLSYIQVAYVQKGTGTTGLLRYLNINSEANELIHTFSTNVINLTILNDILFAYYNTYQNNTFTTYVGIVHTKAYYEEELSNSYYPVYILNAYNLYTIRQIESNQTYRAYLIYNVNNYNGVAFNGEKSVNSNSAILYSNNVPVFARNLYNKTIVDNTEESTINVPTYYLNGVLIDKQELISKNNNVIIENTDSIEKNIYENVLINFFDEITIKDRNDLRIPASSYFVKGLNEDKNVSATKYRVTYKDNTTQIGSISDITLNGDEATIKLMFNTHNGVSKIEILSYDLEVAYSILDLTEAVLVNNSYYTYTQTITIGDE